ncbi:hypothetical protein Ciccas_012258 [Cichlidogyrus casuarinus]|uniref:G-protein coupled receptors family 1 profile domain-containing protein n=1 Tax=Cichlidogyrus casuarinus TaxID=1844966 RepID=A0ABD2PNY7_9PLAT
MLNELSEQSLRSILSNCTTVGQTGPSAPYFGYNVTKLEIIFDVYASGLIIMLGLMGNILSICVLSINRCLTVNRFILTTLALCDSLFLMSCFLFQFLFTLAYWIHWFQFVNFYYLHFQYFFGFGMSIRMMRNWIVVLVSLERWIAVSRPLHSSLILTKRKARIAISIILLAVAIFNLPMFFHHSVRQVHCLHNKTGTSTLFCAFNFV